MQIWNSVNFFILEAIIYEYITKILYFIAINRLERISVIFEIWDGGQNFGVITAHLLETRDSSRRVGIDGFRLTTVNRPSAGENILSRGEAAGTAIILRSPIPMISVPAGLEHICNFIPEFKTAHSTQPEPF